MTSAQAGGGPMGGGGGRGVCSVRQLGTAGRRRMVRAGRPLTIVAEALYEVGPVAGAAGGPAGGGGFAHAGRGTWGAPGAAADRRTALTQGG